MTVFSKYGIKDLHDNGWGWWNNPEQQAEIICRQQAWKALGVNATLAVYMGHYSINPDIAKTMEPKEIMELDGLGRKAAEVLTAMTKQDQAKWDKAYEENKEWAQKVTDENFKRIAKRKHF